MTNANQSWNEKRYNEIALKWLAGAVPDSTAADDLRIVPNPADDLVRISLNLAMTEGEQIQVQVFDLNGRQVHTATLAAANVNLTIPVKGWPEGLYVARVATHNKTFSKTFVVQHR